MKKPANTPTSRLPLAILGVVLVVAVVFLLREKIFHFSVKPGAVEIGSAQPEQQPGATLKRATSETGGINVTDKTGKGAAGEDLHGQKDINVTTEAPPKP